MGYDSEPAPPLTEHQQQVLASVQKQELLATFNQVLTDMGLALTVRSVELPGTRAGARD